MEFRTAIQALVLGVGCMTRARPPDLVRKQGSAESAQHIPPTTIMGLLQLHTQIDIHATPAQIWRVLTDFASYPAWNPFIRQIEGEVAVGERLRIRIQLPGQSAMRFTPRLVDVAPAQSLRWLGHWLVPGLLDGEHHFELLPQGHGTTRLVHSEAFSGLLVGLMRSWLAHTRQGFEAMNQSLKARAEASASS